MYVQDCICTFRTVYVFKTVYVRSGLRMYDYSVAKTIVSQKGFGNASRAGGICAAACVRRVFAQHQPFQITRDQVYFDIDSLTRFIRVNNGRLLRVRNDVNTEAGTFHSVHRQTGTIDTN